MDDTPNGVMGGWLSLGLGVLSVVVGGILPPLLAFGMPGTASDAVASAAIAVPSATGALTGLAGLIAGGVAIARNRFQSWHVGVAVVGVLASGAGLAAGATWAIGWGALLLLASLAWH